MKYEKNIRERLRKNKTFLEWALDLVKLLPSCCSCKHYREGYTHTFGSGYSFNCKLGYRFDSYNFNCCKDYVDEYFKGGNLEGNFCKCGHRFQLHANSLVDLNKCCYPECECKHFRESRELEEKCKEVMKNEIQK